MKLTMICYECDEAAVVAYERHLENDTYEVTGYCEKHDPHPNQPYDTPFDPTENSTSEKDKTA